MAMEPPDCQVEMTAHPGTEAKSENPSEGRWWACVVPAGPRGATAAGLQMVERSQKPFKPGTRSATYPVSFLYSPSAIFSVASLKGGTCV